MTTLDAERVVGPRVDPGAFAAAWRDRRTVRGNALADPHGLLAVTSLRRLTPDPDASATHPAPGPPAPTA